ncbi:MAG TPA: NHL repeat-containing protein, partial [Mucilaginibacter sp.]|nr:NHL repeat-containing protein [Mucilaginibacter sp.]
MKRIIFYLGVLFIPFLGLNGVLAQSPNISYSPATNALTLGTAFTITPGNSGGTVSTGGFSPIYSFSTVTDPWDVTVDASGNVYTISETGNTLYKITPTGTRTTLASGGSLNAPTGVAIDGLGNIYVSNFGTGEVLKYNTSGTLLSTISGFNQPYGISFDASNNAYVGDVGSNTIIKISAGTNATSTYATGLVTPYGTAVDPSGNLYVSEYTTNNDIVKITPAGVRSVFATGFNAPRQLGSDAAGNIYVADYGNNVVKKITSAGVVSTITQATGLSNPRSIQVDAAGSVYIADYGNNRIKKLAATGWTISSTLPAGLTFNTSTGKISGTPTVTFASTTYTVYAYNASGNDNATITLSCTQTTADWKGTTSTAWTTAGNWSTGVVPTQYTAVRIGVVTFTNQPSLSTSKTVSSVTFGSVKQGVLSIATGATLTISDNLTINTGATGATISGAGTAAVAMAPGSLTSINGTGKLTLTSPLSFTLQSDATGDASIGQITSTSIAGTAASSIKVERYLSALRSYRLLSSPVYAGTVSSNNVYSVNYIISNSFLTGTNGVSGGFDKAGNPTIYLFRESLTNPTNVNFTTGNYRGVKDINQSPAYNYLVDNESGSYNLPAGNGFLFFFRGSRSTTNPFVAGNASTLASTLSSSGTLNTGSITVHDWYTPASATFSYTAASPVAGFHLVGNPYASAIDWDTFQQTTTTTGIYGTANVSSAMYVLDPVTNNFGSYIAGSGGVGSSTFVSNVISSGQAFFILENAATSKLIFNESAKTTTQNTGTMLLMGKPANATVAQYMHIQLSQGSEVDDQTLVRFSSQ